MSSKDYIAMAKLLNELTKYHSMYKQKTLVVPYDMLVAKICDFFSADNDRFDKNKFLDALNTGI